MFLTEISVIHENQVKVGMDRAKPIWLPLSNRIGYIFQIYKTLVCVYICKAVYLHCIYM